MIVEELDEIVLGKERGTPYTIKVKRIGYVGETIIDDDVCGCTLAQQICQDEQEKYGDLYTVWMERNE